MGITIYDYFYNNIKGIKKFSSYFPNIKEAKTPKDFYDSFINKGFDGECGKRFPPQESRRLMKSR